MRFETDLRLGGGGGVTISTLEIGSFIGHSFRELRALQMKCTYTCISERLENMYVYFQFLVKYIETLLCYVSRKLKVMLHILSKLKKIILNNWSEL